MFEIEKLKDEEILFLFEMIYGPILVKKDQEFYKENVKKALLKEDFVKNIIDKMNNNEKEIFNLLMLTSGYFNKESIAEKISIILKQPNSIVLNHINNLQKKNLIFLRNNSDYFVPLLINLKRKVDILQLNDFEEKYENNNFTMVINILLYLLTKKIDFSKNKTLYKKDSDTLKTIFNIEDSFLDIICFFYNKYFNINDCINWNNVKKFFNQPPHMRLMSFLNITLDFFKSIFTNYKSNITININDMEYIYKYNLINSSQECLRIDFNKILSFLEFIGIAEFSNEKILLKYFKNSNEINIDLRQSTNYSFFVNCNNTYNLYYLFSVFCDFIRYDNFVEFQLNEKSIERAVNNNFSYEDFSNFINNLNIQLKDNILKTINDWFEKYNSFYYIEGNIFIVNDPKKSQIITKLAEAGLIKIKYIKKNQIFVVDNEEKNTFFSVLEKSNINFLMKKPVELINELLNEDLIENPAIDKSENLNEKTGNNNSKIINFK